MTCNVLISAPYLQPYLDRFLPVLEKRGITPVVPQVRERLEENELLGLIGNIDGVVCGDDRFTRRVLESAKKLRVISKWGTGIDSIDQTACRELGIALCNTPNAFSEPVADSVFAYMLCFARRTPWMHEAMRKGVWEKIPGFALREATLGVIGVGNVGKAVIRRAVGFGMKILGNDVTEVDVDFISQHRVRMVTLSELLATADVISVNCDLNPTSHHLLSTEQFSAMKPNALVINTARGPIIDEPALVAALQNGKIGGVGLDVFEVEPLPPNSPLRSIHNALLAPHNANSSPEAWERVHINTLNNLFNELGLPEIAPGELP
ncbi:phosphoglycerate dehydrogenase [Trichlorobacter ammonificans]|uniref:D-3-phosphoglycerate dehydrogenase n=1 Tax=Trichlorobacter ammonificans TaxID=2916410 RepID=A0ABM9D3W6_9BACT|nr:phosphoglycerate dehydrogenase [Trichlorobacter ammonificans]CAH2029938.1 D-3-phosphoglycerate dehydrogenase [Trichlorobacter ammonificans]